MSANTSIKNPKFRAGGVNLAAVEVMPSSRILARMRDIMAGTENAHVRLNHVIDLIAAALVADVCSCYVARADNTLELFGTKGLNPQAVHQTRLRLGEGLVGYVADRAGPLAVVDARNHPAFSYRPETGEESFSSFCGVPILRGRRVRGVLVIQNSKAREYDEGVIETLQTIAMILAELIVSPAFMHPRESVIAQDTVEFTRPPYMEGVSLSRGFAIGQAVLHLPMLSVHQLVSDDPAYERHRLRMAVMRMHRAIDRMLDRTQAQIRNEPRDILETYRMFSRDRGWVARIDEAIGQGLTAEAAVQRVQDENRARMLQMKDPYIRDRIHDLEDLSNRLLTHLTRQENGFIKTRQLPDDIVLIARNLGPAALMEYDQRKLKGIVLESGTENNHVAIIARAMRIPVVGQCTDILSTIEPREPVILDGDKGVCYLNPAQDIVQGYVQQIEIHDQQQARFQDLYKKPTVTQDGQSLCLKINAGLLLDMAEIENTGADGVGLFRTELCFMGRDRYPTARQQTEIYSRIFDAADGKPITFRTLDIGGDKPLPYFRSPQEANPAMGWRALRMGLDRPALLRTQFRALIRAANGRALRIMLPLVAEASEITAARKFLDMELTRAKIKPESLALGVMVEVPSLLWQLDLLVGQIDFLSVGSNDLLQYLFAADRENKYVRGRYDTLSPAMLRALSYIADVCTRTEIPFSICGEMAGQPLDAMVLAGLGYKTLSMSPQHIGPVKAMLHSLNLVEFSAYLKQNMHTRDASLREELTAYARNHGIVIEALQ